VLIPGGQQVFLVFLDHPVDPRQFSPVEAVINLELNRVEPKLDLVLSCLD
jgi:hypothetical protein